ncbi:hypothetical protein FACS189497_06630 [Betaproteobacteria bacterium]|nr:hypothetical protein FACS189497_06630 [Betaproteobacteria bacterium]
MKYAFIDRNRSQWPVCILCETLEVSLAAIISVSDAARLSRSGLAPAKRIPCRGFKLRKGDAHEQVAEDDEKRRGCWGDGGKYGV